METWNDEITVTVPRAPTPNEWTVSMQAKLDSDGLWHRRSLKFGWTACGQASNHRNTSQIRSHTYGGHMCPVCFAPYEIALGVEADDAIKKGTP